MKVRCNGCEWLGDEDELIFAVAVDEPEDGPTHVCPMCSQVGYLMDLEDEQ